jgi:hypothetical protein
MILLVYLALVLAAAFAVASGVYSLVNMQLKNAGNKEPQFISLIASLFGFGTTIAVVYLVLVDKLVAGM